MIKLKDLLNEGTNRKAAEYFRIKLFDVFEYAISNGKRGEAAFYGTLKKVVKKSKFYPHAGDNEIKLHGKMVFEKAFDVGKKWQKGRANSMGTGMELFYNRSYGWPAIIKDFVESMEMYSD